MSLALKVLTQSLWLVLPSYKGGGVDSFSTQCRLSLLWKDTHDPHLSSLSIYHQRWPQTWVTAVNHMEIIYKLPRTSLSSLTGLPEWMAGILNFEALGQAK